MRRIIITASVVVTVIAVTVGLLWAFQRRLIFVPSTDAPANPPAQSRDVTLRTEDGVDLGAWLLPPSGVDRRTAVLVAHGNAGHRGHRTDLGMALAAEGFTVLLFDYRGYGGNEGSPSETGLRADARAAYRFLAETFPPDRLLYFGESLGAAVVTGLATEHPPAGLLLRSPFVDLAAAGSHLYPFLPVRWLLWDDFPVAEQLSTLTVPTTVVYGTADRTIPPDQSREVADRAGGPVTVVAVDGADHNDPALTDGPQVIAAVVNLAPAG